VPGLGEDFLKSDMAAEPLDAVLMPPIERPDTRPEGVEPVDPGVGAFSREVVVVVDVRRGAGGGLAFSAATLDATDTGFSSSSSSSSSGSSSPDSSSLACKGNCQTVVRSPLYGRVLGYMRGLELIPFSPRQIQQAWAEAPGAPCR